MVYLKVVNQAFWMVLHIFITNTLAWEKREGASFPFHSIRVSQIQEKGCWLWPWDWGYPTLPPPCPVHLWYYLFGVESKDKIKHLSHHTWYAGKSPIIKQGGKYNNYVKFVHIPKEQFLTLIGYLERHGCGDKFVLPDSKGEEHIKDWYERLERGSTATEDSAAKKSLEEAKCNPSTQVWLLTHFLLNLPLLSRAGLSFGMDICTGRLCFIFPLRIYPQICPSCKFTIFYHLSFNRNLNKFYRL